MNAVSWIMVCAVVSVAAAVSMAAMVRIRRGVAHQLEMSTWPKELHDAVLIYREALFRIRTPFSLVARLDRGYQMPDGEIVLVELKTRLSQRPYLTDVLQLSAQRLAVSEQSGRRVAPFGYVAIRSPGKRTPQTFHRVDLMSRDEVIALAHRHFEVLAGRATAKYSGSRKACETCAYRHVCDRPHFEGSIQEIR